MTQMLTEVQNTHMDHLEDLPFLYGQDGLRDAINFALGLRDMLSGYANKKHFTTVKVDGAPAIFCGTNPENGQFFVATKQLFNKTPKINYTEKDIDANHGGGLADKLKIALKYLKPLGIRGILQGDLLFDNQIKKKEKIDGEAHLTFQPNTIKYAVPLDTEIGKQMDRAKIGIAFHTTYKGRSIDKLKASFGADVKKLKGKSPMAFVTDVYVSDVAGTATMTEQETKQVTKSLSNIGKLFRKIDSNFINSFQKGNENAKLGEMILIYTNARVRDGAGIEDAQKHLNGLIDWLRDRQQKEADKVKRQETKDKKTSEMEQIIEKLEGDMKERLLNLFRIQQSLTEAKTILLRKLERIESMTKQFVDTGDGYRVTKPEGFVAVSRTKGNAVKIVDRLEFSRANFTGTKGFGEEVSFRDFARQLRENKRAE